MGRIKNVNYFGFFKGVTIMEFGNKILVIGYGSVSKCTLPILFKHIKIPYKNVTVMDFVDKTAEMKEGTEKGGRAKGEGGRANYA